MRYMRIRDPDYTWILFKMLVDCLTYGGENILSPTGNNANFYAFSIKINTDPEQTCEVFSDLDLTKVSVTKRIRIRKTASTCIEVSFFKPI